MDRIMTAARLVHAHRPVGTHWQQLPRSMEDACDAMVFVNA